MAKLRRIVLVSGQDQAMYDRYLTHQLEDGDPTLGGLLAEFPALALEQLTEDHLCLPLSRIQLEVRPAPPSPQTPLYLPPGGSLARFAGQPAERTAEQPAEEPTASAVPEPAPRPAPGPGHQHRDRLSEREAVLIAHDQEIGRAAAYLESGLSVLIRCEKLLVEHLATEIAGRSGRNPALVALPAGAAEQAGFGTGRRAELLARLQAAITEAPAQDVVVVPHLDLLAGGSDAALTAEARELTDVLYERSERVLLAFTDPSLVIPEVLAGRFAVRLNMDILPREVVVDGRTLPLGRVLVTEREAALFTGFDPDGFYKHVAGMNAVRLRHALRFAYHQSTQPGPRKPPTFRQLIEELRIFKARTSSAFEVPNVKPEDIGGYAEVKRELERALRIVGGTVELPAGLRHDLVPRGFIFHGPPGTGKTLFAKMVASRLGATILVVSGPEITDMYVGESERKVRDLFAEARRNAPAVVVFDEFDSIAARRTGRDDGGSRAGNAVVAQLLTELDGFRPEVPVLTIGTTNRIDIIDDALLRPSRFRPVKIDLPDLAARLEIARVHAEHFGVPVAPAVLVRLAQATEGMNGDEIRSVFREARVGQLLGDGTPPDARRLGVLVGELRRARQQRDLDRGGPQPARGRPAPPRTARIATVTLTGPARRGPTDPLRDIRDLHDGRDGRENRSDQDAS
ncbi:hypothetical protein GCM10009639_24370 [Kitasatospora putterlickiae]|uniref:AAA+ ATPase domain-containing protein n=1 Tax=Kitasatospora putterlickiae TaxID=221725 RepID=A0ABN1XXP3_9ACTN